MKHGLAAIMGVFAMLGLSGCASMSAEECIVGDWHTIGYEDGARGYTSARLGEHRKACAKHGVAPDFQAYRSGRNDGLREFCQPARGFSLGESGGRYNGVCAADQEPSFVDAYRQGQHLYRLRSNVNSARQAIQQHHAALDDIEQQMRDAEAALIAPDTPAEERILLLVDLKELAEDKGRIEAEIDELEAVHADHQFELESYQAVLADAGY